VEPEGLASRSSTSTSAPASFAASAAVRPQAPAPMTTTGTFKPWVGASNARGARRGPCRSRTPARRAGRWLSPCESIRSLRRACTPASTLIRRPGSTSSISDRPARGLRPVPARCRLSNLRRSALPGSSWSARPRGATASRASRLPRAGQGANTPCHRSRTWRARYCRARASPPWSRGGSRRDR